MKGGADDFFVVNVSQLYPTNQQIVLDGVSASQVLFNFTGTGTVFQTSCGNALFGTFLSTNGGDFQFSELHLKGALIDVGGHIEFVSGSTLSWVPLTPVPEPSTYALMLAGLGASGLLGRRRTKKT